MHEDNAGKKLHYIRCTSGMRVFMSAHVSVCLDLTKDLCACKSVQVSISMVQFKCY